MMKRLYDWIMGLAASDRAPAALFWVSFVESSFFPIPPDVMLIPMVIAQRHRAWLIAGVCTIASVMGAMLGYAIGFYLFETIGMWVIHLYGLEDKVAQFKVFYDQYGLMVILVKGLTPIPFKLITIMSGAMQFNFLTFVAACIVTRGFRFFIVAALLRLFGEPIREFIEKRLTFVFLLFLALLVGGFVVVAYL
jgi:membrane protein YqaA with SNARE-associated domain